MFEQKTGTRYSSEAGVMQAVIDCLRIVSMQNRLLKNLKLIGLR